jgi:hypothetical protein
MRMTLLFGLLLSCTTMVNAGLMMGEIKPSYNNFAVRGSRRSLQMNQVGCPPDYSLFRCDDPSLTYEIPCDLNTCLWDVTALDPKSPPASCIGISIVDPHAVDLADVIRPCALWSLMYGEHQSVSPTLSCTLNSNIACAKNFAAFVF